MFNCCPPFVIHFAIYIFFFYVYFFIDYYCGFRSGSVVVDMTLVFTNQTAVPNGTVAVQTLIEALASGTTNLNVDNSTITLSRFNSNFN